MEKEKFPYTIWPGLLALTVLVGSGSLLKQVSLQPEERQSAALQGTDPQTTDSITREGWAEKIRNQLR